VVVVTTPQDLVKLIVEKAVRMADMMKKPVLGLVENMSYFKCPDCGGEHRIFGAGNAEETAAKHGIGAVAKLPIDPNVAASVDKGRIEWCDTSELDEILDAVLRG
jgi:Mrp family chromosome partitioning ATPase